MNRSKDKTEFMQHTKNQDEFGICDDFMSVSITGSCIKSSSLT